MKNKSYIGISLVILLFGIWAVPKIVDRFKNNEVVKSDRLNNDEKGGEESELHVMGKAPAFELTNQDSKKISNSTYAGKVYVVEFFFTTCPTICPTMNANLLDVQKKFFGNRQFGIASVTIDPEHDTAAVLKQHAKQLGVQSENWHFLTGDKDYIYTLANKGFNLYAGTNPEFEGGFEHSGMFALIDKQGRIRCRKDGFGNPIVYYDGLEAKGIRALMEDITKLLRE